MQSSPGFPDFHDQGHRSVEAFLQMGNITDKIDHGSAGIVDADMAGVDPLVPDALVCVRDLQIWGKPFQPVGEPVLFSGNRVTEGVAHVEIRANPVDIHIWETL